jgi:flavin reductase (DIM6/NTAB) family NADH-FMN oxidoreductase RutF
MRQPMGDRRGAMDDLDPAGGMVAFDPATMSTADTYKLMTGSIVPRPIALVATLGPLGPNAAPFSFFNAVAVDPPTIVFSVSPRDGAAKDTLDNIRALPEFVVHIVSSRLAEKMNICATAFPRGTDEIAEAGLRIAPSLKVRPPRIIDCPVQLECRLVQMLPLGRMPYHLVIGEVVQFHYHAGLVDGRFHVDAGKLDALGRLAGNGGYTRITDRFFMPMLSVDEARARTRRV